MIVYRPENKMIPYLHTRPKKFESFPVSDTKMFVGSAESKKCLFPFSLSELKMYSGCPCPKKISHCCVPCPVYSPLLPLSYFAARERKRALE